MDKTLTYQSVKDKHDINNINGSEALLRSLIEEGVDTIFGYPGGAIMPIYDKLFVYDDK